MDRLDFERLSVCEDVPNHYRYWRQAYNANKNDCCDLRMEAKDAHKPEAA